MLPTFLSEELEQHLAQYSGPHPTDRVFPGEHDHRRGDAALAAALGNLVQDAKPREAGSAR